MNDIDRFFSELDKEIERPLKVILTGAMAGMVLGSIRPSVDIDFEIGLSPYEKPSDALTDKIDSAIRAVSDRVGIPAQYSENIQGWSQISFLDYRESAKLYKKIGKIEIHLLAPEHWTIGKMARYLELDKIDVACILKKQRIDQDKILSLWALALRQSGLSDRSREFRDHVIDFIKEEGKKIWGKNFDPVAAATEFKNKIKLSGS